MEGKVVKFVNPNGGPKDLNEFARDFETIKALGFIKTHRSGNTGIGKTLEDLLNISENNLQGPDFEKYELKSHRKNVNSMLTLVTKSPDVKGVNGRLLQDFGYIKDPLPSRRLMATLKYGVQIAPFSGAHALGLSIQDDKLFITSDGQPTYAYWSIEALKEAVKKKYAEAKIVFVYAESRGQGKDEEFWFNEAYKADGIDGQSIIDCIKTGKVLVDLRIGTYLSGPHEGKVHDHGTGLRILPKDEKDLFKNVVDIVAEYHRLQAEGKTLLSD